MAAMCEEKLMMRSNWSIGRFIICSCCGLPSLVLIEDGQEWDWGWGSEESWGVECRTVMGSVGGTCEGWVWRYVNDVGICTELISGARVGIRLGLESGFGLGLVGLGLVVGLGLGLGLGLVGLGLGLG